MALSELEEIFAKNRFCTLACSSLDGQPWVAPLFFNYDSSFGIVWESSRHARHSRSIEQNPRVAIVVADFSADGPSRGIYLECIAREVSEEDLEKALALFVGGPHKKNLQRTKADYAGAKPLRLYEARPQIAYALTQVETADGYTLDERVEIQLDDPPDGNE